MASPGFGARGHEVETPSPRRRYLDAEGVEGRNVEEVSSPKPPRV